MEIIDASIRWPGAAHDAFIFARSVLCDRMDNGEFGTDSVLLGDSAYGADYYMCKPLRAPRTEAEKRYQHAQIKSRNVAERTYGVLKRRFPCLELGLHYPLEKVQDIIVACCILYNKIRQENHEEDVDPIRREEIEEQMRISDDLIVEQQALQQNAPNRLMRTQNFLINNHFNH